MKLNNIIIEIMRRINKVVEGDTAMMIEVSVVFPNDKKAHKLIYTDERIANNNGTIGSIGNLSDLKEIEKFNKLRHNIAKNKSGYSGMKILLKNAHVNILDEFYEIDIDTEKKPIGVDFKLYDEKNVFHLVYYKGEIVDIIGKKELENLCNDLLKK